MQYTNGMEIFGAMSNLKRDKISQNLNTYIVNQICSKINLIPSLDHFFMTRICFVPSMYNEYFPKKVLTQCQYSIVSMVIGKYYW